MFLASRQKIKGGTVFTKDNAYGNCFSIFGKYSFFLFWS